MQEERTGRLKREVEELRERVQREAEEVERRLSFSGILEDVLRRLKSEQYREMLSKNPVALVLLGTGIGMLFQKRPESSGESKIGPLEEKAGKWMDSAKDRVAHMKERVHARRSELDEKRKSALGQFEEKRKSAMGQFTERRREAIGKSRNFVSEYPIAFASGGLILGALLGSAVGRKSA